MWAYRSVNVPLVFFDFTVSRHGPGPIWCSNAFRGKLMADCYAGYPRDRRPQRRSDRARGVRAHARRKVFEARESYPAGSGARAGQVPAAVRRRDPGPVFTPDERRQLRKSRRSPSGSRCSSGWPARPRKTCFPKQVRRGAGLSPQSLGTAAALPGRWADADRQQRGRAVDEADRPGS